MTVNVLDNLISGKYDIEVVCLKVQLKKKLSNQLSVTFELAWKHKIIFGIYTLPFQALSPIQGSL